jgi:hypothetical protein
MTDTVKKLKAQMDMAVAEIAKWATYCGQAEAEADKLRDALQSLLDVQNGPPLVQNADEWQAAVDQARALLGDEAKKKGEQDILARLDDKIADVIWEDGNEDLATLLQDSFDEIERLRDALLYYAANHYPNVNDGPWGPGSNDFGTVARAALGEDK